MHLVKTCLEVCMYNSFLSNDIGGKQMLLISKVTQVVKNNKAELKTFHTFWK